MYRNKTKKKENVKYRFWFLQILFSCSFAFLGGPQDAINLRVENTRVLGDQSQK